MDDNKTRVLAKSPGVERTRLVKRDGEYDDHVSANKIKADAERAKTRLAGRKPVPAAAEIHGGADHSSSDAERNVTGWLAVVSGPGRGNFAAIFDGLNSVGRGPDQDTQIDFGDDKISREAHAHIVYDAMARNYHITHGGKANIVRLNTKPVLQPMELKSGDLITIGDTGLRFVPLCGPEFDW